MVSVPMSLIFKRSGIVLHVVLCLFFNKSRAHFELTEFFKGNLNHAERGSIKTDFPDFKPTPSLLLCLNLCKTDCSAVLFSQRDKLCVALSARQESSLGKNYGQDVTLWTKTEPAVSMLSQNYNTSLKY